MLLPGGEKGDILTPEQAIGRMLEMCSNAIDKVRNWYEQRQSRDQEALGDLIKDLTNQGKKPLSADDADDAIDLANEIGVNGVRDDRNSTHWSGGPHIHIPWTGIPHIPATPN